MKALVRLAAVAAVLGGGCLAYGATVKGILVDRQCGAKMASTNDQKAASAHTRECALMPGCTGSGFGVLTADGKFMILDADGNKKAEAALKASKKASDIQVQVTGNVTGENVKVSTIKIL